MYRNPTVTLLFMLNFFGCSTTPAEFPTQAQIQEAEELIENQTLSPAYQVLYSYSGLPKPSTEGQRVRALIWVQRMNLTQNQLTLLESAWRMAQSRHQQLLEVEASNAEQINFEETPVYEAIWDQLRVGETLDSPSVKTHVETLQNIRDANPRDDVIAQRIEGIQSIMEAQQSFLKTLTPEQEQVIVDALFFLRHKLDPVANPEDFSILVGSMYNPGQFAVLIKGTSEVAQQSMNIGGLWTDEPVLTGRELHEARRETILYLALLEPALGEAIAVARSQP